MTGRAAGEAQRIYPLMRETGRAIMLTRGNNTHSGNLALRDPIDRDVFHITASGSQLGALVASDVVPVRFSRASWGDARASTESTIHRRILSIPGAEASIHAHYLSAISVSFDAKEAENFLLYEGEVHRHRGVLLRADRPHGGMDSRETCRPARTSSPSGRRRWRRASRATSPRRRRRS